MASTDERFRPVYLSSAPDGTHLRRRHVSRHHPGQGFHHRIPARPDPVAQARDADQHGPHLPHRARHDAAGRPAGALDRVDRRSWSRRSPIPTAGGATRRSGCWSSATDKSSVAPLKTLAEGAPDVRTRLHALWTLDGIDAIEPATIVKAHGGSVARRARVRDPHRRTVDGRSEESDPGGARGPARRQRLECAGAARRVARRLAGGR